MVVAAIVVRRFVKGKEERFFFLGRVGGGKRGRTGSRKASACSIGEVFFFVRPGLVRDFTRWILFGGFCDVEGRQWMGCGF